jgi:isopropylmalate/homocitrate/citramalate synthase
MMNEMYPSAGPWHKPCFWYAVPAHWEDEIQSQIVKKLRVQIIDCTLSEGEDLVGGHLSWAPRIKIARMLDAIGVGEITTPMSATMEEIADFVRVLKREGVKAHISAKCAFASVPLSKDPLWKDGLRRQQDTGADHVTVVTRYGVIDNWYDFQRGKITKQMVVDDIKTLVGYAVEQGIQLVYSNGDSYRHRLETIRLFAQTAAEAGAYGIYLFDSRGNSSPAAARLVARVAKKAVGNKMLYIQHHNDLGMATANALSAAEGGADYVDAAMIGVGDRGGTAPLEEVACVLEVYGFDTGINLKGLYELAQVVEQAFGVKTQPWKPIVGWQANKEEGWGHRDPDDPPESPMGISGEAIGRPFESIVGTNVIFKQKGSDYGRRGFAADILDSEGVQYTDKQLSEIEARIVDALISRKGMISEDEFHSIAEAVLGRDGK